jgi:YfiR/HmsC-like
MTRYLIYILSTTLAASPLLRAQPPAEYALKAAVLYNVTKFVNWPPGAFQNGSDPVNICVLGEDPFGDVLAEALNGKLHDDRSFVVRYLRNSSAASGCQVLFISASEQKRLRAILEEAPPQGTLTIGDTEDFAAQGGIVSLKLEDRKIRIQVNLAAAAKSRIRISSRLLSLAEIVKK